MRDRGVEQSGGAKAMSYAIAWVGDEQILYCRLWNSLRVAELRAANADIDALLVTASPQVHLVFHVTNAGERLPSINAMRSPLTTRGRDRIDWVVFADGNAAIRFIGLVVASSLGMRVHSSPNVDDAAAFLKSADPALPAEVLTELQRLSKLEISQFPAEPVLLMR